tara:strand:- start:144 stop:377 length:234 start_codon:yes stop_codon:yes gene_type:complete
MATPKKPAGKTYTLKIPRPQYDRLSDAFNLKESYFQHFDVDEDTITFTISETQRVNWTKDYYISQMFLPNNIVKYTI